MSIITQWGYTLTDADTLPDMLDDEEFDALTDSKYAGDTRLEPMLKSAQAAMRDYCGWHIYPSMACEYESDSIDVSRVIQLPAKFVTAIESVTINGVALDSSSYHLKRNGLVMLDAPACGESWNDIVIEYTAGYSEDQIAAIQELIAHRMVHAMAMPFGITSESADGVSVSYSQAASNNNRSSQLSQSDKWLLEPYRVVGVF